MADEFDEAVRQVLDEMGTDMRELLDNVAITVESDSALGNRLGEFRGPPKFLPSMRFVRSIPSEIVLFENPIRQVGGDVKAVIHDVLLHEIGHYFGLTHGDMGTTIDG